MIAAASRPLLCGYCVDRESVGRDEEGVPICESCRDDAVPTPAPVCRIDRVLAHVHRVPGATAPEIAEALGLDTPEERASLTQLLSRAVCRGQARADGPKSARRYYVDELRPANRPRFCTYCRVELTAENSTPRRGGIEKQCTSCKGRHAINDGARADALRAQA